MVQLFGVSCVNTTRRFAVGIFDIAAGGVTLVERAYGATSARSFRARMSDIPDRCRPNVGSALLRSSNRSTRRTRSGR
jgi:hypothetical protein